MSENNLGKSVELESLVGLHMLSGCDHNTEKIKQHGYFEDCNVINFVLDGVTLTAVEDPSDGYRSMLNSLFISDRKVSNVFTPIKVFCRLREDGSYREEDRVLEFYDVANGKLVLEVGTENYDGYYPVFIGSFNPENMSIND